MSTPEASMSPPTLDSGISEQKLHTEEVQLLRSCESCRRKKRKCSGDRPVCTRCKAQGESCSYRPTARFLKPRHNQLSSIQRKTPQRKKRASIATTPAQHHQLFDHHANVNARPRAMSVVAAALKNAHRQAAAAAAAASPSVTTLAPADLMLSSPLSISTGAHSPGTASAPDLSDIVDPSSRLGMSSCSGLAYMNAATPTSTIGFPASEDKSATGTASPQMLLGSDMPLVTQPQQQMYPQNLAAAMVASQQQQPPALCDALDYNSLLANAITQQQAVALMAATSPITGVMTPDVVQRQQLPLTTANLAGYSPPLSSTSTLHSAMEAPSPLADTTLPHSSLAPYSFAIQPQFALSTWTSLPADSMLSAASGMAPTMAAMACSPQNMFGVGSNDGMASNSMTTLDAILPQSKNLFSEWFVQ